MGGEVPLIVGRGMSPDIPPSRAAPRGWVVVCRVEQCSESWLHLSPTIENLNQKLNFLF